MENLTFLDLVILRRIDKDSTVEKFGSSINTSFFESANLLGGLKVKGLITFTQSIGGQSPMSITEKGYEFMKEGDDKAKGRVTTLDKSILNEIGAGASTVEDLRKVINIIPKDLALHLEKLFIRGLIEYEIRASKITLSLTERGFTEVGVVKKKLITDKNKENLDAMELVEDNTQNNKNNENNKNNKEKSDNNDNKKEHNNQTSLETKRLLTKLEYYLKKYLIFMAIGFIIILFVIGYILFTVLL